MSGSRYDGFPQVFLSGDKTKALEHLGRAKSLLSEVQNMRGHMQVGLFQKTIRQDGVVITARSFGGTNQLFVDASGTVVNKQREVVYQFPAVLSGYIHARGYSSFEDIDEEYLQTKREEKIQRVTAEFEERGETPTEEDLALTAAEEATYSRPTGFFSWDNKTVRAYPDLLESPTTALHKASTLRADAWGVNRSLSGMMSLDNPRDYKSYRYVSGTLYSGAMAKCAQLVLGLHLESIRALTELPPFISEDEDTAKQYLESGTVLPPSRDYVEEIETNGGFCPQYNHMWVETDGLFRGRDHWWLLRIQRDRIYARKLPVFLGSDKQAFAEYYRERELDAVANAIDYFKGLPTGEGFPTAADEFQNGLERGWILDITPSVMPFSSTGWAGYYPNSGWSFSPEGDEAHNVGLRYVGDNYFSKWASLHFSETGEGSSRRVTARVGHQREDEIYAPRAGLTDFQWIPYKVPFATMDGKVVTVQLPTEDVRNPNPGRLRRSYDAVVWAGFVGDTLHTVNYYFNPLSSTEVRQIGEAPEGVSDTSPGAWEWGETRGVKEVPMSMYSSVWDKREIFVETGVENRRVQKKLYEYWYYSTSETGNAGATEWPVFSAVGYFSQENEQKARTYVDNFKTAVVAYPDRSVVSGATLHTIDTRVTTSHTLREFSARGPWRAQGFLCAHWIWFVWRLNCANNPEVVVRKIDPDTGRDLYISRCGQKCEWQMGTEQSDHRTMIVCVEPYGGSVDVTTPAPAICSDFTDIQRNARFTFVGTNTSKSKGTSTKTERDLLETKGWYMCPGRPDGVSFDDFPESEMELAMGRISPDTETGEFHTTVGARNCFGYTYEGFANHLVEGPGYGKLGRLHAGDTEAPRTEIVFVGVLDDD